MRAALLDKLGGPLRLCELPTPRPNPHQVLVRVEACGVCRTDLHLIDGELPDYMLPIVPGHQIVGRVAALGEACAREGYGLGLGQRVGVPWLGWTCGHCPACRQGRENLCDAARFTGCHIHGGYAEYAVADARYCFPLPDDGDAAALAPLLCAGLIGYRALRLAGGGRQDIALYGFGAAAHILAQLIRHLGGRFIAYTRPDDTRSQMFARQLGAAWAGGTDMEGPFPCDAAIIFAPAGELVPQALKEIRKGGRVVCAGIHMSDIPSFPYADLWEERSVMSVANLTRADGIEFLALAPKVPIRTEIARYPLAEANRALDDLRRGAFNGAAVLIP